MNPRMPNQSKQRSTPGPEKITGKKTRRRIVNYMSYGNTTEECYSLFTYLFSKYQEEELSSHEDSPAKGHNDVDAP